jgi:hypothetical protein
MALPNMSACSDWGLRWTVSLSLEQVGMEQCVTSKPHCSLSFL